MANGSSNDGLQQDSGGGRGEGSMPEGGEGGGGGANCLFRALSSASQLGGGGPSPGLESAERWLDAAGPQLQPDQQTIANVGGQRQGNVGSSTAPRAVDPAVGSGTASGAASRSRGTATVAAEEEEEAERDLESIAAAETLLAFGAKGLATK